MYSLITGASSGIGRAMALELAKRGSDLILVARRETELKELKDIITTQYKVAVVIKVLDISIVDNCKQLHLEVQPLNPFIVINNAGFGRVGLFSEIDLDTELLMIDTNIVAVQVLTKLFVKSMSDGIILNVSSVAGMLPTPLMATYAATKSYVLNFSRAINHELKSSKSKLRVLSLNPGPVITEFGKVAQTKQKMQGMSAERCAKIAVKGLLKRKSVIVPGFSMKMMRLLVKFIPMGIVMPLAYKIQNKK
ncbi:MAG: ketoacyl reductase [Tenericutes bacterium HGW-Tenericutes-1]|jgi:hypothetical protein|nr:MAG: ketoacyl reductase [Tenericutes bacterium HGW-Tenericutes-1]